MKLVFLIVDAIPNREKGNHIAMEPLSLSLQKKVRPEDIAQLADSSVKSLTVAEILSITHAIDHQLSAVKRGVLGSDIVAFVGHLLSAGQMDPSTFPRAPTTRELQLCRRLARIEDSDIVTQLQILRMLDVFRMLIIIFQRSLMGVIEDELSVAPNESSSSSQSRAGGKGKSQGKQYQPPPSVARQIDLNSDVCASASAVTEGTLFASANYGGLIPTYALYQLAERYGLDARTWIHQHASMTLLPNSDDAVLALHGIKERERLYRAGQQSAAATSELLNEPSSPLSDDDDATVATVTDTKRPPHPHASPYRKVSSNNPPKSVVVPVEFISTSMLTETFTPLDEKVLRVFIKTFGAFDPNDPHNQFGLCDELVDGHYLRIIPIPRFASVLKVSVPRALKVLQNALEGVGASMPSAARSKLRSVDMGATSTHFDEMDDVFGVVSPTSMKLVTVATPNFGVRSPNTRNLEASTMLPRRGSHQNFLSTSHRSSTPDVATPSTQTLRMDAATAESAPATFSAVVACGYIRYPEFELVVQYLNSGGVARGGTSEPARLGREQQQKLVDTLSSVGKSQGSSTSGAASQQTSSGMRRKAAFAPTGEEEQYLIDEQAAFLEKSLFASDGSLRTAVLLNPADPSAPASGARKQQGRALQVVTDAPVVPEAPVVNAIVSDTDAASGGLITVPPSPSNGASRKKGGRSFKSQNSMRSNATESSSHGSPLHGWPIHQHHAERLDRSPINGRDVNRLRRSFVASPERTTMSYAQGSTNRLMPAADVDFAADGTKGRATGLLVVSPSGPTLETRGVDLSPAQRQLKSVINLDKMKEALDRIPEDPLAMFMELRVSAISPPTHPGANNASIALNPPQLSLTMLHQSDHPMSMHAYPSSALLGVSHGAGTNNTFSDDGLEASAMRNSLSGGPRSATKSIVASSKGGAGGGGLVQEASAVHGGDIVVTVDGNDQDPPEWGATAAGGDGADACIAAATSTQRRTKHVVPLRSNGIHASPWRSVNVIPRLHSETLSDYCDASKRAGGGFGERGRPKTLAPLPPPKDPVIETDSPLLTTPRMVIEDNTDETAATSPKSSRQTVATNSEADVNERHHVSPNRGKVVATVPVSPRVRPPRQHSPTRNEMKSQVGSSPNAAAAPKTARPLASTQPVVKPVEAESARGPKSYTQRRHQPREVAPLANTSPAAAQLTQWQPTKPKASKPAPQPSAVPAPPPRTGFMAMMDSNKQHPGGSLLSFIPPALAADVMYSLDIRTKDGMGRTNSMRGSLLEPMSGGSRSMQSLADPRAAAINRPDPLHDAAMSRNREVIDRLRYT